MALASCKIEIFAIVNETQHKGLTESKELTQELSGVLTSALFRTLDDLGIA
jgi:hypothetical protein